MFGKAVNYELIWDFPVSGAVDESQRWILSAMQRHGQGLVTLLWRILGNEEDVCDAYQSTFLQLAHYKGRQKPEHIKSYIFRVATNTAVSMLKQRAAEKKRLSKAIVNREDALSPENELDSKYLQETLRCHIAQLPEHLRNVIMLRDLGELSYTQTGRILGISAATARVYRCKAVQLLAVWMGKEREERK
ncbi:MAG: sigma-70 family RNA polymerase sigma factor [Phycisphaerae bacterium]|nr:sigma-70 family RNA polymerase sigma factor [Phycisphaerae bacterium]NIR67166.1 sigma-70 family RNA polymerase sigma factor [candidate division Zixibacteria bacterium]NIP53620.1 sigma-70 family RNA polymerase sigma factor [Phycisphaerae bacterium]NIS51890.1 sigma-70 family RNA polymerase sigma factor [Phycisphaerae bacterium]NIU09401.1 sigma-70 family RNA polymerase sigma factor [Phycisphaerae bacterium]